MIQAKENNARKQAQELSYLRGLVVGSNPISEPETAKEPFFLKSHFIWNLGTPDFIYEFMKHMNS